MSDELNGYTWDDYTEYLAQHGDSWDLLANLFYEGNSVLAPIIIHANPELAGMLLFEGGEIVRIPNIRGAAIAPLPPWKRGMA